MIDKEAIDITIKQLELIKDICIEHDGTCEKCPYADNNNPCMIFDVTKSFPDTWNINTAEYDDCKLEKGANNAKTDL